MNLLKTFTTASINPKKIDERVEQTRAAVMGALGTTDLSDALADAISGVLTQFGGLEGEGSGSSETDKILDYVKSSGSQASTQNEFNKIAQEYREELEASDVIFSNAEWNGFTKEAFAQYNEVTDTSFDGEELTTGDIGDGGFDASDASDASVEGPEPQSGDEHVLQVSTLQPYDEDEHSSYVQTEPEFEFDIDEENEEGWPSKQGVDQHFMNQIALRKEENEERTRGWGDGWYGTSPRKATTLYTAGFNDALRVKTPKVRTSQEEEEVKQGWVDAVSGVKPARETELYRGGYNKAQEDEEQENLTKLVTTKRELTKQANQKAKEFENEGAKAFKKFNSQYSQAPYCQRTQAEECTAWLRGWKRAAKAHYNEEPQTKTPKRKKS